MTIRRASRLLLFAIAIAAGACRPSAEAPTSDIPLLVTTIQPFAAILEPIAGGHGSVEKLLPSGASPHTYDPRPSDIRKASRAAAVFFGARELDGWATRLGSRQPISLFDMLPDSLKLPIPDGDHDHYDGHDPHFWTDPLAVKALVPLIADSLCVLRPQDCGAFRENARAFVSELDDLHEEITGLLAAVRGTSVFLAHPFLQYFLHRYDIRLAGVIEELPGREPSPRAMRRIVATVRGTGAAAIFTQPQLSFRGAGAVSEATGIPVRQLDPMGVDSYGNLLLNIARDIRTVLLEDDA